MNSPVLMTDENLGARLRSLAGAVVLARRAVNAIRPEMPMPEQDALFAAAGEAEGALQNFIADLIADDPRSAPPSTIPARVQTSGQKGTP